MTWSNAPACRICRGSALHAVLDYGRVALADGFLDHTPEPDAEPTYPLTLVVCESCGHLQIKEIVSPELLFREYIYLTGVSDAVKVHARSLYDHVMAVRGPAASPPRVIEAASNDGTVLAVFQANGAKTLGVDPARNIARIANERGIETIAEFFNEQTAANVATRMVADVFIARNVVAHVADLHGFAAGARTILAADGIGVIEVPHAVTMFDKLEYDQVFHEHIGYHTLDSLVVLLGMHGLRVFRVEELAIHGGSIRVYFGHEAAARAEHESVRRVLAEEEARGLKTLGAWSSFATRVTAQKLALRKELFDLRAAGKRIAAYGASGKGQSMLQFCEIDATIIDYVVDKSEWKQGKLTPKTHIPIVSPDRLQSSPPDVLLLCAWNLADEIRAQQHDYIHRGGRLLHPLPMPHYIA